MKFFYYDRTLMLAYVLEHECIECGELIGKSHTPEGTTDPDEKFLLSALMRNAGHSDVMGLTISHQPPVPAVPPADQP